MLSHHLINTRISNCPVRDFGRFKGDSVLNQLTITSDIDDITPWTRSFRNSRYTIPVLPRNFRFLIS